MRTFWQGLILAFGFLFIQNNFIWAQEEGQEPDGEPEEMSYIHGDFQSDGQYYIYEPKLNSQKVPEIIGNNSYLSILYDRGNLSGGIRFESFQPPLLGFNQQWKNSGIGNRFINYHWKELSVTVGNFYDQFGNGLIYRSYWEWGLGFDNSVDGIRIRYNLLNGVQVKAIVGKQRFYWDKSPGTVRGLDAEFFLNEMFPSLESSSTKILIGVAGVSKFQTDDSPTFKLPENVASFSGRTKITDGAFSLDAEYAWKANDPSYTNNNIYRPGQALLVTTGYSARGFGVSLGAKRIDNFDFRSGRGASLNDLLINYLPPLTPQHTYRLATLYPYATQSLGEMGVQMDVFYNAKESSLIGGKYGTNFTFNYCRINGIQKSKVVGEDSAKGYNSPFFGIGENTYYQNISLEVSKKLSPTVKTIFSYIFIEADNKVLRISQVPGVGKIFAHIAVADVSWKFKPRNTLRAEAQWLYTKQDNGSWIMGLLEYQMGSHWFFAIYDEYNYGNSISAQKINYPGATLGYTKGTVRISLTGGRQRAGVFCVGGVCRFVPASSGISASVTASF